MRWVIIGPHDMFVLPLVWRRGADGALVAMERELGPRWHGVGKGVDGRV